MFHRVIGAAVFAATLACPLAASADTPTRVDVQAASQHCDIATNTQCYDTGIKAPLAAPRVTINNCFVSYWNSNSGISNYWLGETLAFTNTSSQVITAIRFKFSLFTAFNEVITTRYATDTGTFSPNIKINRIEFNLVGNAVPYWSEINIWPEADHSYCAIDTVRYVDGSIWHAS
jgi:hypothetical protein